MKCLEVLNVSRYYLESLTVVACHWVYQPSAMPGAWMQWALTIGSCSGAQLHFHESAINMQLFGSKRWFLFPASRSTSNKQMRSGDWFGNIYPSLGLLDKPIEFVQQPGDIAVLPRYMTHTTMCLGECASIFWVQSAFQERYVHDLHESDSTWARNLRCDANLLRYIYLVLQAERHRADDGLHVVRGRARVHR